MTKSVLTVEKHLNTEKKNTNHQNEEDQQSKDLNKKERLFYAMGKMHQICKVGAPEQPEEKKKQQGKHTKKWMKKSPKASGDLAVKDLTIEDG